MPRFASLARASALAFALLVGAAASAAPADDAPPLKVTAEDGLVAWTSTVAFDQVAIEISGPDGIVARRTHAADDLPSLDMLALGLADGEYSYRAVVSGLEGENETLIQTGSLAWADGVATASMAQVFATDVIVQGSICTGFDCVNGESFGFDTLRLKENNLRIHFQDTSNSASFPTADWRIRINDTSNGGANYFAIEDSDAGTTPFLVRQGAGNNALYVDAQGDVGLNTSNPVVELHISDGDSPTVRLEQSGASGFTPQTWDMAGNETNFFIRDVTNGSKLPFRIRPSAPDNSVYIDTDGDVGMGTNAPTERLDVRGSAIIGTVAAPGNLTVTGALTVDGEVDIVNKSIDVDKDVKVGRDLILQRNLEMTDNYESPQIPFFILDRNNSSNAADDVMLLQLDSAGNLAINGTLTQNGVPFNATEIQTLKAENEDLRERIARLERLVEDLAARDQ